MASSELGPCVVEYENFDPVHDAKQLRRAMKGFGTDEEPIIEILAQRTNKQRQEIRKAFRAEFNRSLVGDLESELSRNLEKLTLALCRPHPKEEAFWLRKSMKGMGTDEGMLIEMLCTRTQKELNLAKKAYEDEYKRDLVDDVSSELGGDLKKLLVAVAECRRPDDDHKVDEAKAALDAKLLLDAGEKKRLGTDEAVFIKIFTERTLEHLREVFKVYSQICDYDIVRSIQREFSGDMEDALVALAALVRGEAGIHRWFAERLYKSMKGLGTDDDTLRCIVVTRSEIDMAAINEAFNTNSDKYNKTLQKWIKDDISGDYKKMLLLLLQRPLGA